MFHERKKNDKMEFIQIKNFCSAKGNVKRRKRQDTDWDKTTSDKGLVSKIYKELLKFNNKKTNNLIKKWAKHLNRYLIKEDTQMANNYMKGYSTSYFIRKMQIKTIRYHNTHIRMAKI